MINIKKTLLLLVCILFVQTAHAVVPIQIEVKVFGKDIIFVFYRDKDQIIDLKQKGDTTIASINIPSEFKLLNPNVFNKYASGIHSAANKQRIIFQVSEELQYQSIINGERLDAIKFRAVKKKEEKEEEEDLSKIGAANNDPGAIRYTQKDGDHVLSFNLGNADSKVATFFKGKHIWIVFDQKKTFSFTEGGIFSKFEVIPSEKGTVLRMRVEQGFDKAKLEKIQSGWSIRISQKEDKNWKPNNIITPKPLIEEDGFILKGKFKKNKIISFEDPELGDLIAAVPLGTDGMRVTMQRDSIEFSLLRSIQGIAIVLYSDDVSVEKYDDAIKVISDTALPEDATVEANIFPASIDEYLRLPTILPYRNKKLDILDFNRQKSRLIMEASLAQDKTDAFDKNLKLAKFFFIHEMYHEAIDVLQLAKKYSYNDYQQNLQARFLTAVSHTLVGEHGPAKEEFDDLLSYNDIQRIAEINIWNKYNEFAIGSNPGAIGVLSNLAKTVSLYSDDKYWPLIFSEIELAIIAHDLKAIERIFREIRAPKAGKYANSLKFYKARYYKKKKQINLAKQYYRDLAYQDTDVFNKVRATFNLIKLRMSEKEIEVSEAIEKLESLRYEWRGDKLEYEILMQLAEYYRDSHDIMNALRTYQYIQLAFNNKVSNFYITSEMARIFNSVFLPGGLGEEMDDFTVVALFYEFKELNPIGDQGDDVIIGIAKRLVRLDLLDNAIGLMRHQVNYRLKGERRVKNADNLAIVLLAHKKPSEAIFILDETDKDNTSFKEHEYRVRLRARALISLEEFEKTLSYLKDDTSEEAEIIRREAVFQSKDWNKYADLVNADFEGTIANIATNNAAAQDILRLAISYYMLNVHDQLIVIANAVGDKNKALKNTIDLLITSSGPIDIKNLDRTLNIDQMKTLLDKYKNQFLDQ